MCAAGMELCPGTENVTGLGTVLFLIPAAIGRSLLDLTLGVTHGTWHLMGFMVVLEILEESSEQSQSEKTASY